MSGGGGGGSTTVQSIPDELKPLATTFTQKATTLANTPWTPYTGQRFEDFNKTQLAGLQGIEQQAQNPLLGQASDALSARISGSNPYLESMIGKASDSVMQNFRTGAMGSGSFGNSGLEEQAARGLADVNVGLRSADYAQQLQAIGMAPGINAAGYQNAEQLLKAGQIRQDQTQQGRDFAYQQYMDRQNDPYRKLAAMSGVFGTNLGGKSETTQSGGK
jgi:hypothetical protein